MPAESPVGKALWFIESHLAGEINLQCVAEGAGVSRFHLSRAFSYVIGMPVMVYVRGRRLSEAAKTLAAGAPDILAIALDSGYSSHEAFTRAFREYFGITPDSARTEAGLANLKLLEPIRMEATLTTIAAPRIEQSKPMLIAGLSERYTDETSVRIPAQWQRFTPWLGNIPGQVGNVAYGVICNTDEDGNTEYITGVEVAGFSGLPKEFTHLRLPARKYAVFFHAGHISTIRATWAGIWNQKQANGMQIADAPSFERYDERFDPATGNGGVEIWVPVAG
jgi:AraC family transcriptional regulator